MKLEFEEQQEQEINNILSRYCTDAEYRDYLYDAYDNETYKLKILEIYFLEKIINRGNKDIYDTYTSLYKYIDRLNYYDDYMKLLTTDKDFCKMKLVTSYMLQPYQLFIMKIYLTCIAKKYNIEIYDPFRTREKDVIDTLRNYFLSKRILSFIDLWQDKVKFNQFTRGQFSKESKKMIINLIREGYPEMKYAIEEDIDKLLEKSNVVYIDWSQCKTNIGFDEVFGKTKEK